MKSVKFIVAAWYKYIRRHPANSPLPISSENPTASHSTFQAKANVEAARKMIHAMTTADFLQAKHSLYPTLSTSGHTSEMTHCPPPIPAKRGWCKIVAWLGSRVFCGVFLLQIGSACVPANLALANNLTAEVSRSAALGQNIAGQLVQNSFAKSKPMIKGVQP